MTEWKNFIESRTVWANFVGLAALILSSLGYGTGGLDEEKAVEVILQIVMGASFLGSTLFRVLATRRITV
ncbi:MAG: hypothetical protein IOC90_11780 [Methylocystis sp.]|jgi:hypothetical protein|nr:hypothetical protein [Methylocystis sp.]MCA3582695.1 hypothetical protein [Methylocystis sp.]MCA3588698.1 hypothetical protein [Methylocystis sp.]MCA3591992.1 hypothetical protein [Methylocystis sp.]